LRILQEGTEAKEKARLPVYLASGLCKSPDKTNAATVACSHARPRPASDQLWQQQQDAKMNRKLIRQNHTGARFSRQGVYYPAL